MTIYELNKQIEKQNRHLFTLAYTIAGGPAVTKKMKYHHNLLNIFTNKKARLLASYTN